MKRKQIHVKSRFWYHHKCGERKTMWAEGIHWVDTDIAFDMINKHENVEIYRPLTVTD